MNQEKPQEPPIEIPALPAPQAPVVVADLQIIPNNNVVPQNALIPFEANLNAEPMLPDPPAGSQVVTNNNQLKQAPILFSGATFNNCTINLNVPQ